MPFWAGLVEFEPVWFELVEFVLLLLVLLPPMVEFDLPVLFVELVELLVSLPDLI